MGTALARAQAQTNIWLKAQAQGVPGESADGMDVLAVEAASHKAAETVRAGHGPFLLQLQTYRFRAHSMADPDLYRSKQEIAEWRTRDPITTFTAHLRERRLLSDSDLTKMENAIASELAEAVQFAEASPWEPIEDLTKDVCTPEAGRR
jgi:TPP-dependent pyruvate/acetoin dehydrogenase alpha subunit